MNPSGDKDKSMKNEELNQASDFFSYLSGREKIVFIALLLKKSALRLYKAPFGRLMYSTRFCRWDWLGIALIFSLTFFFSILAGQNAMMKGHIGHWYSLDAAPVAISIYNTGKPKQIFYKTDSKLSNFINKGCVGAREYSSITNEEAKPQRYGDETAFYNSTAIAYLMAWWWKMVGHPDWSTLYILFSILNGLTMIAAYMALRQVIGVIPSVFLGLLLSAFPQMMSLLVFSIRDGSRALFCFIAIAVLLYLLKRGFNWKGTLVCSFALFAICSLSKMLRNDFIVFIPFIIIATVFFHGKPFQYFGKKALIVSSIIVGLIVASQSPKPGIHGFNHVLYVGLADTPYMEHLHFSAENYSKGIPYADYFAFVAGAGKAYRNRKVVNLRYYSKEYDREIHKELLNLVQLYPYDFLRLAFSSSIQSLRAGYRSAKKPVHYIETAPGYELYQKKSKDFYLGLPPWLYFVLFILTMLLFLGGRFYANIILCIAIMCMSGCYLFQFDLRHYFFLMLIPLLSFGFILNRTIRIAFLLTKDRKRIWSICLRRKKTFLLHCAVLAVLVGLAVGILQIAKEIQRGQIRKEIDAFNIAKTENVKFGKETGPSKVRPELSGTKVLLPDFYNDVLAKENPKQVDFTEFLKVKFKVADVVRKEKIDVFATFNATDKYSVLPTFVSDIINATKAFPIHMTFYARPGTCTLYMPVYFSRGFSPLTGIELFAEGKDIEIESVERIAETEGIHTQSAFLIPEQAEKTRYYGKIDWHKVLWEILEK